MPVATNGELSLDADGAVFAAGATRFPSFGIALIDRVAGFVAAERCLEIRVADVHRVPEDEMREAQPDDELRRAGFPLQSHRM